MELDQSNDFAACGEGMRRPTVAVSGASSRMRGFGVAGGGWHRLVLTKCGKHRPMRTRSIGEVTVIVSSAGVCSVWPKEEVLAALGEYVKT